MSPTTVLRGRDEALAACARKGVGVLAMKPFAGGKLLLKNRVLRIHGYQRGNATSIKKMASGLATPARCLSYTLSQPAVSSAVTGGSRLSELEELLRYGEASSDDKDYSGLLKEYEQYSDGECVYCDHCLPCPLGIEIGYVIRLLEMSQSGMHPQLESAYNDLKVKSSDCNSCGLCSERCPFNVDVVSKMRLASQSFR